jgi:lipoate-protein ligase A
VSTQVALSYSHTRTRTHAVLVLVGGGGAQVKVFPREVMAWVGGFYAQAFAGAHDGATFALRENDYVWGVTGESHRKFGGNAQRMSSARYPPEPPHYTYGHPLNAHVAPPRGMYKHRWLQHTSFLWDFDDAKLNAYLALPEKQPAYRQQRPHSDFVCRLKDRFPSHSIGTTACHPPLLHLGCDHHCG